MITINIRNETGQMVHVLEKGIPQNPGDHTYKADINVRNRPKGKYWIYVYEDFSNVHKKVPFEL